MEKLQTILEDKIQRFLISRNRPANSPQKIRQAIRSLDVYYWKKAEGIIQDKAPQHGEVFTLNQEERLLFDAGVVNQRLSEQNSVFFDTLAQELIKPAVGNIFYLSEWLQYRWEFDTALDSIEKTTEEKPSHFRDHPTYQSANENRMNAVQKIQHLIRNLPGVPPSIFDMILSGRMMIHLEDILFESFSNKTELSESNKKLLQYYSNLCNRLQERCLIQQHQKAYSEWIAREDQIQKIVRDSARDMQVETQIEQEKLQKESTSRTNMAKNLKLIRSLIPLGVASSDIKIAFSPFFADANRCTKPLIARLMQGIREVDPFLPGDPDILIAPFCGNGFFEWDHNTLILPLTSEHSQNMALVNAVAGYRIMTDALNFNGLLHQAWTHTFGPENFKNRFVEAYHNWILGIGYGRRHAMPADKFKFFINHIGPNPKRAIGPGNLLKLDNEGQLKRLKECHLHINSKEAQFDDIYDAAVIHWRRHNMRDALEYMEQAFAQSPHDARLHFSIAYLREHVKRENCQSLYHEIIEKYPKSLWKVYAEIALGKNKS